MQECVAYTNTDVQPKAWSQSNHTVLRTDVDSVYEVIIIGGKHGHGQIASHFGNKMVWTDRPESAREGPRSPVRTVRNASGRSSDEMHGECAKGTLAKEPTIISSISIGDKCRIGVHVLS